MSDRPLHQSDASDVSAVSHPASVLSFDAPSSPTDAAPGPSGPLKPRYADPVATLAGVPGLVAAHVLNDKRHVLTRDSTGAVAQWDVLAVGPQTVQARLARPCWHSQRARRGRSRTWRACARQGRVVRPLGQLQGDLESLAQLLQPTPVWTPNWFTADIKTGVGGGWPAAAAAPAACLVG